MQVGDGRAGFASIFLGLSKGGNASAFVSAKRDWKKGVNFTGSTAACLCWWCNARCESAGTQDGRS